MRVAFVGLGAMGRGMAANLLDAGHEVRGFDVAESSLVWLQQHGGAPCTTVADACTDAEALVSMVVNDTQTEAVLFGDNGAVGALGVGALVMLCSTMPPRAVEGFAERAISHGWHLLDAPVSGGTVGAEAGTLSIMAAGDATAFELAAPLLDAMAGKVHRMGDQPGMGAAMKVVHQLAAGTHLAVAAEVMALGAKAGLAPQTVFDVISGAAGRSWMFENRVPHMLDDDYTPQSAVEIFVKDLGLVLDAGKTLRFPLPLAAAAHQQFLAAAALGHGQLDDAAVVKVYEALAGVSVKRRS